MSLKVAESGVAGKKFEPYKLSMLRELSSSSGPGVGPGIWIVEKPLVLLGQDQGSRMTVVRLSDGTLFLHSPVKLTEAEHGELARLGLVAHVVAPNLMHHLALPEFAKHYPAARFYGARGLDRKRRDILFSEMLSNRLPPSWRGELEAVEVEGMPKLNEVAFLHRSSRTLILTDLVFNLQKFESRWAALFAKLNDSYRKLGPSRYCRFLIKNPQRFATSVRQILGWNFERIVLSHGEIVASDAKDRLQQAFAAYLA